jgi:phosphoribosylformylglycinamidine (FGAM) synthase PurS component
MSGLPNLSLEAKKMADELLANPVIENYEIEVK